MNWIEWIEKFGLPTAFGLIIASMFFFLLKWVLEQSKTMLEQMAKEREAWLEGSRFRDTQMVQIQENNKLFTLQVNEAHKYQREEHKEMVANQQKIIENANRLVDNGKAISECLKEVKEGLARVNGYKHRK